MDTLTPKLKYEYSVSGQRNDIVAPKFSREIVSRFVPKESAMLSANTVKPSQTNCVPVSVPPAG